MSIMASKYGANHEMHGEKKATKNKNKNSGKKNPPKLLNLDHLLKKKTLTSNHIWMFCPPKKNEYKNINFFIIQ